MEERHLKTIVTRVPPELAEQVEQLAKQEMLPVAALVRRMLAFAVRRVAA